MQLNLRVHFQIFIFTMLVIEFHAFAQETKDFDLLNNDIELMLPKLETIIDSAIANDHYVKFREMQVGVNMNKLRANQVQWSRNIGIQADARYGTFNNFSTNTSEGQSPSTLSTLSSQLNYGLGAYIKFPLFDLIGRKTQIGLSEIEVKQAEEMAQMQRIEVRQIVIKQYNELILQLHLYRNKLKFIETTRINLEMANIEFQNGVISIGEYARISDIANKAESDLETSKAEFITAYMIMEEISGMKFKLNNIVK
jgi:outer membrane protein TolC